MMCYLYLYVYKSVIEGVLSVLLVSMITLYIDLITAYCTHTHVDLFYQKSYMRRVI